MTAAPPPPPPRFGDYAERYARWRPVYPPALYDLLLSHLSGLRAHAADLGAGTGQVALDLLAHFERVTAVEPDPGMAALIPRRKRITIIEAKAEEADFAPASLDAVVVGTAFHWMDEARVCGLVRGWLRPGGVFLVFAYDRFSTPAAPAVQALVDTEAALWRGHKHESLSRIEAYDGRIRATGALDRVEPFSLDVAWRASPEALAGFWMTTSFATAHARATGDEHGYAADFSVRMAQAARGADVEARYVVYGALAIV